MATDRGSAVGAAARATAGLKGRGSDSYGYNEWRNDTIVMADHLLGDVAKPTGMADAGPDRDTDDGPDNPVTDTFLAMLGFADPTGTGNVWVITDPDGRELKYTMLSDATGGPTLHILDGESDGASLIPPNDELTEPEMFELCHILRFPVNDPSAA